MHIQNEKVCDRMFRRSPDRTVQRPGSGGPSVQSRRQDGVPEVLYPVLLVDALLDVVRQRDQLERPEGREGKEAAFSPQ